MTDGEKLAMVFAHIDSELKYLAEVIYHHQCNITEPDHNQQMDYAMALGQRRALMELSHKLMGLTPPQVVRTYTHRDIKIEAELDTINYDDGDFRGLATVYRATVDGRPAQALVLGANVGEKVWFVDDGDDHTDDVLIQDEALFQAVLRFEKQRKA